MKSEEEKILSDEILKEDLDDADEQIGVDDLPV